VQKKKHFSDSKKIFDLCKLKEFFDLCKKKTLLKLKKIFDLFADEGTFAAWQ
jgi:hypothetical protein